MDDRTVLSSVEMCQRAGMTYRELDWWTRLGHLRDDPRPYPGSGVPRRYPADELAIACAIVHLRDTGVPLDRAALIARTATRPAPGDSAAIRLARGVLLVVTADLWTPDDEPPHHLIPAPR